MTSVPISLQEHKRLTQHGAAEGGASPHPIPAPAAVPASPPEFLLDDIARAEWTRVLAAMPPAALAGMARWTLLAGYCNAVARAVRAEQALVADGQYYESRTGQGIVVRRRHPALRDAEQGWNAARHLARQLGITGGAAVAQERPGTRRSLFK